jgi:cytochrome c-type biogenesis protein CcmH
MVESLARKVRERPDDAKGWALLARSMAALGRFQESADAYEHLAKLQPNDPDVLADWADSLGMAQGARSPGDPRAAREGARHRSGAPEGARARGHRGAGRGRLRRRARYWQRVAAQMPPGSPDAAQVEQIIAEVRGRPRRAAAPCSARRRGAAAQAPPSAGAGGRREIRHGLGGRRRGARRSVTARTNALRLRARRGRPARAARVCAPARATLADRVRARRHAGDGARHEALLAEAVRIEARVSRSGNAMPQPGRSRRTSALVKPGRARREDRGRQGAAVSRLEARALACSRGPATLFRGVSFALAPGE